ncbi:MAG: 3-hydroxyacyl-CoA dehydrogenase NAD-binding domain-containing protein [Pseudomonadota bacterium]|nr:3-hydroxyacyl-CoA dehydrogenase NAD-binding domain-containing protein [Pseudomonadota bacterium]
MTEPVAFAEPEAIRSVAVIGAGAVGASWAALFLARNLDVWAFDPTPGAALRTQTFIAAAWPALVALNPSTTPSPPLERLRFTASAGEAAANADLVQENTPEDPNLKARIIAELDAAAGPHKILLSSTGGILPTDLQSACRHPKRFIVLHPFNPAHLIPLVEVVAGRYTAPEVVDWTLRFARLVGKHPICLNREAAGHMTNRLQFALLREAVHCLQSGIASATDIDAAVRYGLGPRWTLMGGLMTLHLAGGPGGMAAILEHAGAAIESWWAPAADVHLDAATRALLVTAAQELSQGRPIAEWTGWRDQNLVRMLQLLQQSAAAWPAAVTAPGI